VNVCCSENEWILKCYDVVFYRKMPGILEGPSNYGKHGGSYYQGGRGSMESSMTSALRYREHLYRPSLTEIAEIETVL
jgi:hypothetical protein